MQERKELMGQSSITSLELDFVSAASALEATGSDLRHVASIGLSEILGKASAEATVYYLGEEAFQKPIVFVKKLEQIFDGGSGLLISRLTEIARAANRVHPKC